MDTQFAVLPLDVISQLHNNISHFLQLPHPRTGIVSLFLAHESTYNEDEKQVSKILEVQAVDPPNARSWFNGDQVISDGKLVVMTPIDPLFLLIPILRTIEKPGGSAGNFQPAEDLLEDAARHMAEATDVQPEDASQSVGVEDIMKFAALECTKKAMRRLCEVKEVTAEITVFRYSSEKLLQGLRKKVEALCTPQIMHMSRCLVRSLAKDALMDDQNEDLLELGRTKLACELLGQYLPQDVLAELLSSYDLARLDAHVKALAQEQASLAELSTVSKKSKTGSVVQESKKRKKEGKGSQSVEKLKKANISGMSKLSTFFTKKIE